MTDPITTGPGGDGPSENGLSDTSPSEAAPVEAAAVDLTETTSVSTYPGAPESLIEIWNVRRRPLTPSFWEALPPLDVDLKALVAEKVDEVEPLPRRSSAFAQKEYEIRLEFVGRSELAALNAFLISHLRKSSAPEHAAALFQRIWTEEADALLLELPSRWLISSAITFGDHGINEQQRRIGLSINVLFSLMKLYEQERLYTGRAPTEVFNMRHTTGRTLPLDMPRFSLLGGGLDINLLAQIWQMALEEPVAGRLARHLLQLLNDDPRSLFRRIEVMREALRIRRTTRVERTAARKAAAAAAAQAVEPADQAAPEPDAPDAKPTPDASA